MSAAAGANYEFARDDNLFLRIDLDSMCCFAGAAISISYNHRIGNIAVDGRRDALCCFAGTPFITCTTCGRQGDGRAFAHLRRAADRGRRRRIDRYRVRGFGTRTALSVVSHDFIGCGSGRRNKYRCRCFAVFPLITCTTRSRQCNSRAFAYRRFAVDDGNG